MRVIVGLGNPGEKYCRNRHNIGFIILDKIMKMVDGGKWMMEKRLKSEIGEIRKIGEIREKVLLVKPLTFMNESGEAVRRIVDYYKVSKVEWRNSLFVVHDELDLQMGRLKIQQDVSAAGHHGVESVIEHLGTKDFIRFRLGVQAPFCDITTAKKAKDYLLSDFTKEEMEIMLPIIERTAEAVLYALENGVERAMNRYN